MSKQNYRGAIVGAGKMGRSQALAFGKVAGATITATYDIQPAQAAKLAADIGATAYEEYAELLKNVDFIVLCTPPAHRVALFRQAVEAGVAVLLEKPLAADYDSAKEVVAIAAAGKVPVGVGFCHRFVPAVQEVLQRKKSGAYGRLRYLSQSFICGAGARALRESWMSDRALSGGGVIIDTLCHSIDMTQFLGGRYVRESAIIQSSWPGRAETAASIQALTEEDVIVEVRGSWDYPISHFDLRAIFETAEISYTYGAPHFSLREEGKEECLIPIEGYAARVATQAEAFIALLEGGASSPGALSLCNVDDAASVSRVMEACYRQNGIA